MCILSLTSLRADAQNNYFERNIHFTGSKGYGSDVIYCSADSSNIILADVSSCGNCFTDQALIKVNYFGDTVWIKFSNTGHVGYVSYRLYSSGERLLAIGSYADVDVMLDILVADTMGNFISRKSYPLGTDGYFYGAVCDLNDTFFVCTNNSSMGNFALNIYKIDWNGDSLSTHALHDNGVIVYPSVITRINDTVIGILCETDSSGALGKKMLFINSDLDSVSQYQVSSSSSEHFNNMLYDSTAGIFYMFGYADTIGGKDFCFRSLNNNFSTQNFKCWGTSLTDYFSDVQMSGNGFIATGTTDYLFNSSGNLFLMRLDTQGAVLSSKLFGQQFNITAGSSVFLNSQGDCFMVGNAIYGSTNANTDIYYLKTDSAGIITVTFDFQYKPEVSYILIGTNDYVFNVEGCLIQNIELFDLNGRLSYFESGNRVSLQNLNSGFYIVRLYLGEGVISTKIIVNKSNP